MYSSYSHASDSSERSCRRPCTIAFIGLWVVCFLAVIFPAGAIQAVDGAIFLLAGLLLIAVPPVVRVRRSYQLIAFAMLVLALGVFLPAGWFHIPAWRQELEKLGLATGSLLTAHPRQALEQWIGLAVCVVMFLFIFGHRITDRAQLELAWLFSFGVSVYAVLSMLAQVEKWKVSWDSDPSFGFFPNRNHTATLLVMGAISALGCLFQSIRTKRSVMAALSAMTLAVCHAGIWGFSESRAGALLVVLFSVAWITGLRRNYLTKRVQVAIAGFAILGVVLFIFAEGTLKSRLTKSVDKVAVSKAEPASNPGLAADSQPQQPNEVDNTLDFRQLIYKDTLTLLKNEPVTGVGMGMFQYVFPHYRHASATAARAMHPESDWLMVASEEGILTMLVLAGGTVWLLVSSFRSARKRHQWPLRLSGILAAAVVPVHGLFDVPGHRIGLALSAVVLLALTQREDSSSQPAGKGSQWLFRVAGLAMVLLGGWLARAQWTNSPVLSHLQSEALASDVRKLYAEDEAEHKAAAAAGKTIPQAPDGEDKLEIGIKLLDRAIAIEPLKPEHHFLKGLLAMNFTDMYDLADREFAIERALDPRWVRTPLRQSQAWTVLDADRTERLWQEALRRSDEMGRISKDADLGLDGVQETILQQAMLAPPLMRKAFPLLRRGGSRLEGWAKLASPELLDELLPEALASSSLTPEIKLKVETVWKERGGKEKAK